MSDIKHQFDKQGFVALRSFLSGHALDQLQNETKQFIHDVVPTMPSDSVYYEDRGDASTLKQLMHVHHYSRFFRQLAQSDEIVSLVEELLGEPAELQEMQYFRKAPHTGTPTPAHQDGYYFMIRPHNAVTLWLSLSHADASNGAIRYLQGSHKQGVRPHGLTETLGFSQGITDWSEEDEAACVQMEATPGDLLIHHCLTVHLANPNRSNRERASFGLVFYGANVEVDEGARAAYQASLDAALKNKGRI